jgi:hypothetical protein
VHILRPLFTLFILSLATISFFVQRHPLSDGILSFVLAAVVETWTGLWRLVEGEVWKSVSSAQKMRDARGEEMGE